MEKLYSEFTSFMGEGEKYDDVPEDVSQKYKDMNAKLNM